MWVSCASHKGSANARQQPGPAVLQAPYPIGTQLGPQLGVYLANSYPTASASSQKGRCCLLTHFALASRLPPQLYLTAPNLVAQLRTRCIRSDRYPHARYYPFHPILLSIPPNSGTCPHGASP